MSPALSSTYSHLMVLSFTLCPEAQLVWNANSLWRFLSKCFILQIFNRYVFSNTLDWKVCQMSNMEVRMISLHQDFWTNSIVIHSALARLSQKRCYVLPSTLYQETRDGALSYIEDINFHFFFLVGVALSRFLHSEVAIFHLVIKK